MRTFSWKSYLLTASATLLTVFLALFAACFALTDTFPLTPDPGGLLGLCLLSALVAALVCAVPRVSLRAGLTTLLCGLLALFVWWRWDAWLTGAQVVFHQISYTFHQEIPSVLYYPLPTEPTPRQAVEGVRVFFSAAAPLLSLWLGPWLTRRGPVWPAVATVSGLVGLPLLLLRQPGPLPLAAFLLFLTLTVLSRKGYRESAATGARRVLAALLPAALVMALLGAVLPRDFNPRPRWVEDLRLTLQRVPTGGVAIGVGGPSRAAAGKQSLKDAGPLHFDGHTVLQINSSSSQSPLFLRGFSAGEYTAQGWEQLSEAFPIRQLSPDRAFLLPSQAQPGGTGDTVRVTDLGTHADYYYLPYYPTALPFDASLTGDAYLTRPGDVDEYLVSFLPEGWTDVRARLTGDAAAYEQEYRQWVYDHYLDVPRDLLSQEALAQLDSFAAAGYGGPVDAARAARDYLSSFTQYDQQTPRTPAGEDFVSWFLTGSHRGYCVHYASAATLMLRACGVPTRYVSGYVARPGRARAVTNVPDRNAHAWVEVYVDGFGWQPVDVTPGFSGGGVLDDPNAVDPAPSPDPTPTPSPSAAPTPSAPPSPAPSPSAPPQGPGGPTVALAQRLAPLLPWLCVVLGLAAVAALIWLQARLRLARLGKRCAQPDPNAAALALYRLLLALRRRAGVPLPDGAEALAQKAYFSQHTLTAAERAAMETFARAAADQAKALPLPRRLLLRYLWALI